MDSTSSQIASALKTLRKDRGWSLDKAAQETGVSKAMLGQIERAESSPTISTLWKIASGFKIPFSLFIADDQPDYGTGQTKILHPSDDKIKVLPIFPFDEKEAKFRKPAEFFFKLYFNIAASYSFMNKFDNAIEFFDKYFEAYPDIFRKSWAPYKDIMGKKSQKNLSEFSSFLKEEKRFEKLLD